MTQADRVLRWLRWNPGSSTMEIQLGLEPFVSNPRARISDLRARGFVIEARKRADGYIGFYIVEAAQQSLGLTA